MAGTPQQRSKDSGVGRRVRRGQEYNMYLPSFSLKLRRKNNA